MLLGVMLVALMMFGDGPRSTWDIDGWLGDITARFWNTGEKQ